MNILVTGGAGYIGSTLVPELLAKGHTVSVIDDFRYKQTSLLSVCHDTHLKVIRGDARDTSLLEREVRSADVILPLACLTGAPLCAQDPIGAQTINHDAVKKLYDMKSPSQHLIFPCTNSGYGVGEEGIFCTEDTPMKPVSLYGRLKVELEKYLLDSGHCVTFRFATVFGVSPRMRLDLLVNDFVYRALNDKFIVLFEPHFKRNYLHVRDAAQAFIHAIENYDRMKGKPYNVGLSDANISKLELCERIAQKVPGFRTLVSDVGEDPDKRNYIVSNDRIERTGYQTQVSLDSGIVELLKGYQILKRNEYANF